ncbi:MAG TPA: antirestriction protein ArdA [Candidatus Paceibacterota bacterium]
MDITFSAAGYDAVSVNVETLERQMGDGTADTLSSVIMLSVASWAVAWGVKVDDVEPGNLIVGGGEVSIGIKFDWMVEVAQLFRYFEDELSTWQTPDVYLAYLSGQEWDWADFDNIDDWTDEFHSEYPDDLDDFGRERMAECEEGIPEYLERYFDYVKYAEDVIEGYNEYEWNGVKYLFSE